jgi:hypothetical protein
VLGHPPLKASGIHFWLCGVQPRRLGWLSCLVWICVLHFGGELVHPNGQISWASDMYRERINLGIKELVELAFVEKFDVRGAAGQCLKQGRLLAFSEDTFEVCVHVEI